MFEFLNPKSTANLLTVSSRKLVKKLSGEWQVASTMTFNHQTARFLVECFEDHPHIPPIVERIETYVRTKRIYLYRLSPYGAEVQSYL